MMKLKAAILIGLLMTGLISGPGKAAKPCKPFKPVQPAGSPSTDTSGAVEAPVVKVTDKATADNPLVIEFDHAPALADVSLPAYPAEDPKYFNLQINSKKSSAILNLREEWAAPSPSDIDMWLFSSSGSEIANSVAYNPVGGTPAGDVFGMGDDGNGFEVIGGIGLSRCSGVTLESRPASSPGESMTLKVWLD